ncbi:CPBP family intramembrane metalloprotease [candidate division WOR-3 bacterium]|uniref:CPBP family intramembrane metalloprotease n=1 Tax=candidate division WOR-3 bacterium TaxID=2052148 RepID=A0A937XEB9_UNCW3|nr:CPBP family intramembrane metalloprotease [candidate division WOR-3 bacterium]
MAYLRGLWSDLRRNVAAGPDLLFVAAVFALAALIPHYFRPRVSVYGPGWPGAVTVLWRSVVYLALPLLSLILLRMTPAKAGFRLRQPGVWLRDVGLLYLIMLPLVYLASRQTGFQRAYPYFAFERLGFRSLLLGLGIRAIGMFAWEFLCRGYLLFGFERRVGATAAIAIQTIPFAVMHAGKPGPEAIGSIVAGIVLGIIALRNRSFIPGAILHWAVAATLDIFALAYV